MLYVSSQQMLDANTRTDAVVIKCKNSQRQSSRQCWMLTSSFFSLINKDSSSSTKAVAIFLYNVQHLRDYIIKYRLCTRSH